MYTRVYVCHSNEKARVHCIFACDAHTHTQTQAHARVRRLYVRIDRRVATAEPWSDFNFYVERERTLRCVYGGRRRDLADEPKGGSRVK